MHGRGSGFAGPRGFELLFDLEGGGGTLWNHSGYEPVCDGTVADGCFGFVKKACGSPGSYGFGDWGFEDLRERAAAEEELSNFPWVIPFGTGFENGGEDFANAIKTTGVSGKSSAPGFFAEFGDFFGTIEGCHA